MNYSFKILVISIMIMKLMMKKPAHHSCPLVFQVL